MEGFLPLAACEEPGKLFCYQSGLIHSLMQEAGNWYLSVLTCWGYSEMG
jgi:hypothetical protein